MVWSDRTCDPGTAKEPNGSRSFTLFCRFRGCSGYAGFNQRLGALLVLLITGCSASTGAPSSPGNDMDNPSESLLSRARQEIEGDQAILIDVREQVEWDGGHLAAAILIPMSELRDESQRAVALQSLPKDRRIYTHCAKGVRAQMCAELLQQLGYDAEPLTVDYTELVATGFSPVP